MHSIDHTFTLPDDREILVALEFDVQPADRSVGINRPYVDDYRMYDYQHGVYLTNPPFNSKEYDSIQELLNEYAREVEA